MSRRSALTAVLVCLVGAAVAGAFFSCFERRAVERTFAGSAEARRNPFLAAGRFLEAMGLEVRALEGPLELEPLPPPDATLLFTPQRRTLSEARHAALRAWVESGGHLIVETWQLWDDEERRGDSLLDPLGFEAIETPVLDPETPEAPDTPEAEAVEEIVETMFGSWREPDPSLLRFPDAAEPLVVVFDAHFQWRYTGDRPVRLVASGEAGEHLIQIELGRGRLTALTDGAFLHNDSIGDEDHAEALLRLVAPDERAGPVWIVTGEQWPGLLDAVWRRGRPALAGAGLWLAAFLWRASRRRGPVRPAPSRERRSWLEHLDAVGRFHWRRDRGRALRESLRASLLRDLERSHPGWRSLSPEARHAALAAASDLDPEDVARALAPASRRDDREGRFVDAIRSMERIRKP